MEINRVIFFALVTSYNTQATTIGPYFSIFIQKSKNIVIYANKLINYKKIIFNQHLERCNCLVRPPQPARPPVQTGLS